VLDDESKEVKRPNSKYSLSKPDNTHSDNELSYNKSSYENLNFHYSRERRLESAPESVKKLYRQGEEKKSKISLLGPLIADRPRRILFFIIILMCAAIIGLAVFGFFDTVHELDGNRINVTAAIFEDMTIVVLRKTVRNQNAFTGAVDLAVTIPIQTEGEDFPIFSHRIFFHPENEETFRFAVPFNASEMYLLLQNYKSELRIRFSPE